MVLFPENGINLSFGFFCPLEQRESSLSGALRGPKGKKTQNSGYQSPIEQFGGISSAEMSNLLRKVSCQGNFLKVGFFRL